MSETGTPSTTYKGCVPAPCIDLIPRIMTFARAPGCPEPEFANSPGTRPCKFCVILATGLFSISLLEITATDPAKSDFLTFP
ncbi:hypothetical protein D3C87_1601950 [compost metagenome]